MDQQRAHRSASRGRRGPIALAVVGFAAVGLFGLWVGLSGGEPLGIDRWWHDVAGVEPGSAAFAVAVSLAWIGSAMGVAACVAIAAAALAAARRYRDALTVCFAAILGVATSELLKVLVARPRPADALLHPHGLSYPSGHSMGAAALSVSLALVVVASERVPRGAAAWACAGAAAWTLLMMWSRTAVQVHWITDTVAGAALGVASAILARALWGASPSAPQVPPAPAPAPAPPRPA